MSSADDTSDSPLDGTGLATTPAAPSAEPAGGMAGMRDLTETAPAELLPTTGEAVAAPAETASDPAAPARVAEPAQNVPAPQGRAKTKGVADIVFVVDISGSMAPCIDALRRNIEAFVDSLSTGDANNAAPVKDWRAKVVGYRDFEAAESEGLPWIVDNPFVRDAGTLKAQLAQLQAGMSRNRCSTRYLRLPAWMRSLRDRRRSSRASGATGATQHA